jgi:hypothetical protein
MAICTIGTTIIAKKQKMSAHLKLQAGERKIEKGCIRGIQNRK